MGRAYHAKGRVQELKLPALARRGCLWSCVALNRPLRLGGVLLWENSQSAGADWDRVSFEYSANVARVAGS
jgi:hypothetical protein